MATPKRRAGPPGPSGVVAGDRPPGEPVPLESGRRLDPEARRAQLLALGLEQLRRRPLGQLLVDDVIRAAGISKGLLFHYFPTKRDFLVAIVRTAADELLAAVTTDPDIPVLKQLRAGLEAYIGFIEDQPASYVALVRGAAADEALLAVLEDTRAGICDLVLSRIGAPSEPVLRMAIRGWIAMVEETTLVWLRETPCSREDLLNFLERTAGQSLPIALALRAKAAAAADRPAPG
ncbi:MAG: TetR/AcrR family transcriptional regulator [Acidimicrobiia bacterium]